jgi:hypothetical protein
MRSTSPPPLSISTASTNRPPVNVSDFSCAIAGLSECSGVSTRRHCAGLPDCATVKVCRSGLMSPDTAAPRIS